MVMGKGLVSGAQAALDTHRWLHASLGGGFCQISTYGSMIILEHCCEGTVMPAPTQSTQLWLWLLKTQVQIMWLKVLSFLEIRTL